MSVVTVTAAVCNKEKSKRVIFKMKSKTHSYTVKVEWTGNPGQGTRNYKSYTRNHEISIAGKQTILASSAPPFRGDSSKYNPEELLVASLSTCHMLWYLHLCAEAGIVVTSYADNPTGTMAETENGSGHFTEVILKPSITISTESDREQAIVLHHKAHKMCFIANSVNFPVDCQSTIASI